LNIFHNYVSGLIRKNLTNYIAVKTVQKGRKASDTQSKTVTTNTILSSPGLPLEIKEPEDKV